MPLFNPPTVVTNERIRDGTFCAYHLREFLKTGQDLRILRLDDAPGGAVCDEPTHPGGLPAAIQAGFIRILFKVGL